MYIHTYAPDLGGITCLRLSNTASCVLILVCWSRQGSSRFAAGFAAFEEHVC